MARTFEPFVERTMQVAAHLAAEGNDLEACMLISSAISGMAAALWPGDGGDRRRFVEVWTRFADPDLLACRVSLPLLVQALRAQGRHEHADSVMVPRASLFGLGQSTRVVTGDDIDLREHEILAATRLVSPTELRKYSYPSVFYTHYRSALVHEYGLGKAAAIWSMTRRPSGVSYVNRLIDDEIERHINFDISWLSELVRSIARNSAPLAEMSSAPRPSSWWISGEVTVV
jgi:hypothetical protein